MRKIFLIIFNPYCGTREDIQAFCELYGSYWYTPFGNCIFFSSLFDVDYLSKKFDEYFSIYKHTRKMYMIIESSADQRGFLPSDLVDFIMNPDDKKYTGGI